MGIGEALSTDYFLLREQLTDTQLEHLARTRRFVTDEVLPTINDYWDRAEFPWPVVEKLGAAGLVGDGLTGYGCPPMDKPTPSSGSRSPAAARRSPSPTP